MSQTNFQPGPFNFTHAATLIGGQTTPGDRIVKCNGHTVGRVHKRVSNTSGVWEWYCWLRPSRNGTALDQNSALGAVKKDVLRREVDGMIDFNYPPHGSPQRRAMRE